MPDKIPPSHSRRTLRRIATALVLTTVAAVVAGCTSDVTAPGVQAAFGQAFGRLYRLQLQETGHNRIPRIAHIDSHGQLVFTGLYTHASCHKQPRHSPQVGAGDDWICVEFYQRPSGTVLEADYDVTVRTDGCLVATGPAQVVGQPMLETPSGKSVVNPIYQIYSCLSS